MTLPSGPERLSTGHSRLVVLRWPISATDFDTGRSLQIPSQMLEAGGQTLLGWLEQNGIDAVAIRQGEELGLSGIALVFEPRPPSAWGGTRPLDLYTDLINSSQQLAEPMTFKARQYQPVYAFKTREGGLGELQMLSVDKVAGSVTFRYRMLEPPTPSPVYGYFEVDAESDQLASSVKRLKYVGLFVQKYAADHNGRLPDTLPELKAYVDTEQDYQWIVDNVEYLGKGMTTADSPTRVIAYDRTLMNKGKGTNAVYLDGSVAYRSPAELNDGGLIPKP
jgi:prepilin-type processing-associated H-X9-DG protein